MKKILALAAAILLMLACMPTAYAAGSVSWKGPSTVRAGDTITLTFSAGGGIYGGSGTVSFDSDQLTLKKYSSSVSGSWETEFNGNKFVFFDGSLKSPINSSTAILKASFTVNKDLAEGTEIAVTVKGITLSDGKKDISMGSRTYSATIAPPLSGNCQLASLKVSNAKISPAFSSNVTSYTASVPYTTSKLDISAAAEHPGAKVSVKNPTLTPGGTTTVSVTVKAENGAAKTYSIKVKRAQDPNYVESANAQLKSLAAEQAQLSPAFSPEVTHYYLWLPYETETVTLKAAAEDSKASAKVGKIPALEAGKATDIAVTVTAENGTQKVYTVTAVRAPAYEDTEDFLSGKGAATEPVEQPTEPTEPVSQPQPQTQPQTLTTAQILILAGGGAGCLVLGIFLGILFRHLAYKRKREEVTE